jgi:hypothetical protein
MQLLVRAVRALERQATAQEQLVLIAASAPSTSTTTRLRAALLRAESPAQVVSLWRRASADIPRRERAEAGSAVVDRLVHVGAGQKGLETGEAAKSWLTAQMKVADAAQPGQAPAKPSAAGGRSGR